jgi:AbrB family looped-hinge helix DNA binding protein/excisionase family DNA binding protein
MMAPGTPHLAAVLAELAVVDERDKAELARHLRPYLGAKPERLLSAREKAELMGIHPDTLVKMARDRRIHSVKVGRAWRFRADAAPVEGRDDALPERTTVPPRRRAHDRRSIAAIRGAPSSLRAFSVTWYVMPMSHTEKVTIGDRGRLVLPASVRTALKLTPGTQMLLSTEDDGSLRLRPYRAVADKNRGRFAHHREAGSLVDELIADRRGEAAAEE